MDVKFTDYVETLTDTERGVLYEKIGPAIQAMVDVRARVREEKLRELYVSELRRLGYTVYPPEDAQLAPQLDDA